MNRSKRFVFVPFCLLSQGVRAQGIVKQFPAIVEPVVDLLMELKVNIYQMPCPELFFDKFQRRPCGKSKYDTNKNRSMCQRLGKNVASWIKMFKDNNCAVEAILGIENSPSCAVNFMLGRHRQRVNEAGIFIEELQTVLQEQGIEGIPFVGVQIYHIDKTLQELRKALGGR